MPPRQCFISYAHYDAADCDRLLVHVKAVMNQFPGHTVWHDRQLYVGNPWHEKIQSALKASDIYVLLVTSDFFASDYIQGHEWPFIRARHLNRNDPALVLPLIVAECPWEGYFQDYLQVMLTAPQKGVVPLREWGDREKALGVSAKEMTRAVREHFGYGPIPPGPGSSAAMP